MKIPIAFIITLFIISCSTPKEEKLPATPAGKAQFAIQEMMKKNVPHPESYQAVSFGALDSVFSEPDLETVKYYQSKAEYFDELAFEILPSDFKQSSAYSDSSLYYSNKVLAMTRDFKKQFTGYKMEHSFQASNSANLMTKDHVTIYFDTSLQIISLGK